MVLEWAKNLGYLGFKIGSKFSVENNTLYIYLMGGVVKYKIVAVVRKDTKYTGELAS